MQIKGGADFAENFDVSSAATGSSAKRDTRPNARQAKQALGRIWSSSTSVPRKSR